MIRLFFNSKPLMKWIFGGKFAANGLDDKISIRLKESPGFFLEIGGNDGFSQSNTKRLELFHSWTGVLVEPYHPNFKRIFKTRTSRTTPINAACVPFGFEEKEVNLSYSDLMTTSLGLESDLSDPWQHVNAGAKWIRQGGVVKQFTAPAKTLNEILIDTQAPRRIQFFSLDVEGVELSVLKGVDHEAYRFDFLLVESRSPDVLMEYLSPLGYEFVEQLTGHDYLYRDSQVNTSSKFSELPNAS
jgi:FkbM family methyltransferase